MPELTPIQFLAVYATPVTPVAATGQAASGQSPVSKMGASAAGVQRSRGSEATQQPDGSEPREGGPVAEAYHAQRVPRVGSQGRLGEDAGSGAGMLRSWAGKLALIAVMVWVMQQPLPGLLQSFAYGERAGAGQRQGQGQGRGRGGAGAGAPLPSPDLPAYQLQFAACALVLHRT